MIDRDARAGGGARAIHAIALVASGLLAAMLPLAAQAPSSDVAASLRTDADLFWLGDTSEIRESARVRLEAYDVPTATVFEALRAVPRYPADAERGRLDRAVRNADGRVHPYTVLVPEAYTPNREWPVLVYLHGGINRPAWTSPGEWWRDYDRIADEERIVIVPASWRESMWWQASQIESLGAILSEVGREYRLDRNRVHMVGISDGGTGAYYHAFRSADSWASFLIFIGHAAVLSNPRLQIDGQMYVRNLQNRSLFIVNGGRDRLYPSSSVEPFVQMFRENDVALVYRPKPASGHDLSWLPEEATRIDSFIVSTPRDPLPDRLAWETEDPASGRFSWVRIDRIGDVQGQADMPDRNDLPVNGQRGRYLAFPHDQPSGRLEAVREGNTVRVRTEGVTEFTVLVSPREFDLALPIRVEANGRVVHDTRVAPSNEDLMRWAAADRDPEMLFVAEISVDLTRLE